VSSDPLCGLFVDVVVVVDVDALLLLLLSLGVKSADRRAP